MFSGWNVHFSVTARDNKHFILCGIHPLAGRSVEIEISQLHERYGKPLKYMGGSMKQRSYQHHLVMFCIVFFILVSFTCAWGASENSLSDGQKVYVSVYSNIYYGDRSKPFNLAAMLSVRNTDQKYPLTILQASYYDSEGSLVKEYVKNPIRLAPMASTYIYVKESDTSGGSGANFIVQWKADHMINEPIIECLMTGLAAGQGISFICNGRVIEEHD